MRVTQHSSHSSQYERGRTHTVHTVHEPDMAGKHDRLGTLMTSQLLSINQYHSEYCQRSIHSSVKATGLDSQSTSPSIPSYICTFLSVIFCYQTSKYSATQTSQDTKRVHFNIRILLEVRSLAAPIMCAKTCGCKEWRPLGVAVSLCHSHY